MTPKKPKRKTLKTEIVGIHYRVTPYTRKMLASHAAQKPLKVVLEREPLNTHDKNAIRVVLISTPLKGLHLGYVPRGVAEVLSPKLKSGKVTIIEATVPVVRAEDGDADLEIAFTTRKTPA